MSRLSEEFSDAGDIPNENAKDRMHGWLHENLENVSDDDLKAHLDVIFAEAVPESLLTLHDRRRRAEQGGEVVDALNVQFREIVNQKEQLEANIIENRSLHARVEEKEIEITKLKADLSSLSQECSNHRLQIAVIQEQIHARSRNEERLQSEADRCRDELAIERRSEPSPSFRNEV